MIDDIEVPGANAGGVLLATDGTGNGVFSLTNSVVEGDNAAAISVGADGNSTAVATIRNNSARVINTSFFGVSNIGVGADGNVSSDTPVLRVTIDNNVVTGGDANGIDASSRGSQGSLDVKIVNNTISNVGSDGVRLRAGNGTAGETDTVRAFLAGNVATSAIGIDGFFLRDQSAATSVQIAATKPDFVYAAVAQRSG